MMVIKLTYERDSTAEKSLDQKGRRLHSSHILIIITIQLLLLCIKKFFFRSFLLSIVEHILSLYDDAPSHELRDYCAKVGGEEMTHVYPNFLLWRAGTI